MERVPSQFQSARRRNTRHRGVALLLAIFAMVVVGTTTVTYVASRDNSLLVARNAQLAADGRALAADGVHVTEQLLRNSTSNWRTSHVNGRLLDNYTIDGGTVTVDLVDIQRRDANVVNPWPIASTTEVEVTVTSTRNGSTWTSVADMSIPSVVKGQYAIYAKNILGLTGTNNFIGRWPNAPMSSQNLRINIGTQAALGAWNNTSPWLGTGVWLQSGTQVEPVVSGHDAADPDTLKSTWVYYPYTASGLIVQGTASNLVAAKHMAATESAAMIAAPTAPSAVLPYTNYTAAVVLNHQTVSYTPFRIKATLLPQLFTRNFECRNSSVVTLTAGTYEVWGSWILRDSRVIISGDVKIVINPNLALTGLDWQNSSVELNPNATLQVYNGYSMDVRSCWVGSRYTCPSEPNPTNADGDPHKKVWFNQFTATTCTPTPPTSPTYIEPWRIRFYPMPQFLSSWFIWDIRDTALVGSIYLPTNPVRLYGNTKIYGRIACNQLLVYDTASFYYDHALDEVSGLTEGTTPSRGGDPDQMFPERVVRYGFDAETAR